jgi:uncharacterized protein YbjT (DUF2867 family)
MNVLILGSTGMVGQGVLREALLDPTVSRVVTLVRTPTGQHHEKLREIVHADLTELSSIESELTGIDACFFCIGISVIGLSEAEYTRVTYDLTTSVASTLLRLNPAMTFVFVSGMGADSTEQGRAMWARVKGKTENALLRMPFKAVYVFRPGVIVPLHGIRSRTRLYRVVYAVMRPLAPVFLSLMPRTVTTTERLGQAMLRIVRKGYPKPVLEPGDFEQI